MINRIILLWTALVLSVPASFGGQRNIHILATNDMHASVEMFPQLAAVIDSLRDIDPGLLVFSAGDNRTGNPLSDKYEIPSYPMVAMMNMAGFNASALGNHEFDSHSLPRLIGLSNFRYLCANVFADDTTGIRTVPCQMFDANGVKVGVVGAIQVGSAGFPSTHPDNLHGVRFVQAADVLGQYEWLSRECDVTILLSHLGYFDDVEMANRFPWLDLIIGGHTHKQLKADEPLHGPSGVMITQCSNGLRNAAHITLTVDSGRVVDKRVEYINVKNFPRRNNAMQLLLDKISDVPHFKRVIASAKTPFGNREEIGYMVCDAYRDMFNTDFAMTNYGGVRINELPAGDITVLDALKIDPYDNKTIVLTLTGQQLTDLLLSISKDRANKFPFISGLRCKVTPSKENPEKIGSIKLTTHDGKKLDMKRHYTVTTNSYVATTNKLPEDCVVTVHDMMTNDLLIQYLEKKQTVSYKGIRRLSFK